MKKLLLFLWIFTIPIFNTQAQCGPGQDTTPPVFGSAGDGTMANPFRNLLQTTVGVVPSGRYYFNFNGATFQGELDNDTDGGGWLMILNYVHIAGDNSNLTIRNTDLPLLASSTLGDNEAGTVNWGHMGNALAADIDFEEIRFYGATTAHNRIIDFKTSYTNVLSYVKTGAGSFSGINNSTNFTALASHTANIPAQAFNTFTNQGDLALTNFPFWRGGLFHWGIKGGGNRWEVDDFAQNTANTIHRVWVRGDLSPTATTSLTISLDQTGNATVAPQDFGLTVTDNCGTANLSLSQTDFDCTDIGSNTIQLIAADDQNNSVSIDVTVIVEDTTGPQINITADLSIPFDLDPATNTFTLTPADLGMTTTDNCEVQDVTISQTVFDCSVPGGIGITITATDSHGNQSVQNITVVINDPIPPTVNCVAPFTLFLDGKGEARITANDLGTFSDNCNFQTFLSKSSFTCADIGDNTVTLTVHDNFGNLVSCDVVVTVDIACPTDMIVDTDPGACGAVINYSGCGTLISGMPSGSLFPIGTTNNVLEITDANGITTRCSFDVTVNDTSAPVFSTKDLTLTIVEYTDTVTIAAQDLLGEDPFARDYTLETTGTFDRVDISASGTVVTLEDDELSLAPIGFEFGFYGNRYTEFYISSNGFITFSDENEDGCCSGQSLPDTSTPNNLIAFDWTDLNPEVGGTIRYTTIGTAPNRITIIDFDDVRYYDNDTQGTTSQIKLFEGTNRIEIHGTSTFDSGGNDKTQGIENSDGTAAITVPGRNADSSTWSTTNDYVAFAPITGAFDNCGIDTIEASQTIFGINDARGTVVTLTVTDVNGNVSEQTVTVTVISPCPIDELPDHNFQLQTSSETCVDKNNGVLSINTIENSNYIATLNGEAYPFNSSLIIENLPPGTYPICIAIDGITDCEKCYEFVIEEAPVLVGKATIDDFNNQVFVEIESGTAPYTVTINDKVVGEYSTNSFVVDAKNGEIIEVSSSIACQGKLSTTVGGSGDIAAYPNPTQDYITLNLPHINTDTVTIDIHNALGVTVSSEVYIIEGNKVEVSMQSLPAGIYFIMLQGRSKTIRISKQ